MKNSKEYANKYRLLHRERYLEANRKWRERNREKYRQYFRDRRKTLEGKYARYKYESKRDGKDFEITFEQFKKIFSKPCHYCGDSRRVGIDRKNNKVGYVKSNCLPCCWPCNRAKSRLGYDFFIERCLKIAQHLSGQG